MKLYVVVEGCSTEMKVYDRWLSGCFPGIVRVNRIEDMTEHSMFLVSGNGYPSYLRHIEASVGDAVDIAADLLLICVDSEEMACSDKLTEIEQCVSQAGGFDGARVIVQHCCIETWFLGNPKAIKRNPTGEMLPFARHYDVWSSCPEGMTKLSQHTTKAQTHFAYLRAAFQERGLRYGKSDPGHTRDFTYLQALVQRHEETKQLPSFGVFLKAIREFGGAL